MRIIIDVDDTGVTSTRIEGADVPMEPLDVASETPPPEILKAAKKLGAKSAGPAAIHRVARRAGAAAIPSSLIDTLAARRGDEDAGEAPAGPKRATKRKAPTRKRATPKKTRAAAKKKRAAPKKKRAATKKRRPAAKKRRR